MISIEYVSYRYDLAGGDIIKDICLQVREGELVVLCGRSGCGKTTLIKTVNGIIPHLSRGKRSGGVSVAGREISDTPMYELSKTVGTVFQNPKTQFFNLDTDSEMTFILENQGLAAEEIQNRLECATKELGIAHLRHRDIFKLSGGEKQLVAIAALYIADQPVIVMDEPTANLDAETIETLKRILGMMKKQGKTILVAEHRLSYLAKLADRVVYMSDGKIQREYPAEDFFSMEDKERKALGLRSLGDGESAVKTPFRTEEPAVMCAKELSVGYGKTAVLEGLHFQVHRGEIIGITGKNGVGKSTLCRVLCGLEKQQRGMIYDDREAEFPVKRRCEKSFCVMQDVNRQLFGDSVYEECLMNAGEAKEAYIADVLKQLDLYEFKDCHPMTLSGGQKQRLAIADGILLEKSIYFFDEPTSGLDYDSMVRVGELLSGLAKGGAVIFLITHDFELLDLVCDRCFFLTGNQIIEVWRDRQEFSRHVMHLLTERRRNSGI